MTFARLDVPDALEFTEFYSDAVCGNSLSRAPSRLDLRAQGPIFANLETQQSIYRFQLFQLSERDGVVLFFTGGLLLKKYPVGPAFAPESSVAHILASRSPNDACRQALNSLQTIERCASF